MVVINWYYVVTNQYKFLILMGMCILLKISQTNFTHISKKKNTKCNSMHICCKG